MRKRKLRTALTGITIVLITFAMLCFMSTTRYSGQTQFEVDAKPNGSPGVLVRRTSSGPLPYRALPYLQALYGPGRLVVPRWWWANTANTTWRIHVRTADGAKRVSVKAALGLEDGEQHITAMARSDNPVLPNWPRFIAQGGCYLADQTAEQLGASPGDRVIIAGRELELIGTFGAVDLEAAAIDIDGRSILPSDYSAVPGDERSAMTTLDVNLLMEQMTEGAAALHVPSNLPHLHPSELVIVRGSMLKRLNTATLRSVAVAADDADESARTADDLAQRLAYPIYYSTGRAVHVIATTPLLPVAPKRLIIPLIIGGLIIFNTMLSSIAERKRDIYIYTSLGLAPLHVAFLFLAEAATYGLMGSIFGYIAGQGVATVLSQFGLLGGITLNYSGTQAITVMASVLLVVMASSAVPAYLGGRLAAPSNERTWRVPDPQDDVISDTLPFTVTPRAAPGVVQYLHEYLDAHREGSIGRFATDDLHLAVAPADDDGPPMPTLSATVWLAPFDLGVRQHVRLRLHTTDHEDVLGMAVELHRRAGQERTWWKLNRVFLGDLRRQLLGWRKVRPQRILEYIESGSELIAAAPHEPNHA